MPTPTKKKLLAPQKPVAAPCADWKKRTSATLIVHDGKLDAAAENIHELFQEIRSLRGIIHEGHRKAESDKIVLWVGLVITFAVAFAALLLTNH